jgi:hypothetical protein
VIEHSPDITELAKALIAVQGEVDGVKKDAVNPHFRNRYASLESVIDTARPALQRNGVAFTQAPGALVDGAIEVTTMLVHSSGQWMRSTVHMPLSKKDAQGAGSAITYGCRYSLMAALGLPAVDDDGDEASKPMPPKPAPLVSVPAGGACEHLIELITHARSDDEVTKVTNTPANVRLYENLDPTDQDRVSEAVSAKRATFVRRRA